ncbi:MAG: hypothetical protein JJU45_16955 [Acidimicrobiia bacterium]|nr:hypothetical protein [Acidimicrobiia bacterium]
MSRSILRRRARVVAPLALGLLLVAGCTIPSNQPEAYGPEVEAMFEEGCLAALAAAREEGGTDLPSVTDIETVCSCRYDVFVANVPYDEEDRETREDDDGQLTFRGYPTRSPSFVDLNQELQSDPEAIDDLPDFVREELEACSDATEASVAADDAEAKADEAEETTEVEEQDAGAEDGEDESGSDDADDEQSEGDNDDDTTTTT